MFHINTAVVKALMILRRISIESLANSLQISPVDCRAWLSSAVDAAVLPVSEENQMHALKILGIAGDSLRDDVIHYWFINEGMFSSSPNDDYSALSTVMTAFGSADVIHLDKNISEIFTLESSTYFLLKFSAGFSAIVKVTCPIFKSHSFHLQVGTSVSWVSDSSNTALLSDNTFEDVINKRLTPKIVPQIEKTVKSKELANKLQEVISDTSGDTESIMSILKQVSQFTALENKENSPKN